MILSVIFVQLGRIHLLLFYLILLVKDAVLSVVMDLLSESITTFDSIITILAYR